MEEKKVISPKKEIDVRDLTICDATAQMLTKARRDGVETAFDRAINMKACPIGADSAGRVPWRSACSRLNQRQWGKPSY